MRYICLLLLFLIGCGGNTTTDEVEVTARAAPPFAVPGGFTADVLPFRFDGPTQFVIDGDSLWVAELNGGENAEVGRVLRVNLATREETIVLENLDKPTGIAILDGDLYVATRNKLLKYSGETLTTVLDDLPNNGRSNGTLTVSPDGEILYETSGNRRSADSAKLWAYDPTTNATREIATGFKGAYAHVYDDAGRLWSTEVADGSIGGETLPDEVNLVIEGGEYGWPRCYGRELAGPDCENVRPAVLTFAPRSTPTGIAVSPFSADTLLVALWVTGDVVRIPVRVAGDGAIGIAEPFITGMQNPQHIVVADDAVYISEYATGKIWQISAVP